MGHLINPISNRLSVNTFWNSNWSLVNNFNYINLFKKDYVLFEFLDWFLKKSNFIKFSLLLSHYKIYRVSNNIFINFYYYNVLLEDEEYETEVFYLLNLLNDKENNISKLKKINKNYYISNDFNNLSNISLNENIGQDKYEEDDQKEKVTNLYIYVAKILFLNLFWSTLKEVINFY